jgi:hypothetical protein
MANNIKTIKKTISINQIFNDLDRYRNFCVEFGYRFNEADLYNIRSWNYRQFQRMLEGYRPRNQWEIDYAKYKERQTKGFRR